VSTRPVDGLEVDVAVIGGGPAGSTAATLLSRAGHRVAVLERERFPREHIGESLLPIAFLALDQMGITDKVLQAGFVRKYGATYIWGRSREPWTLRFSEMIDDAFFAFQVRRAEFDKILLDHSEASGATVWEETQVTEIAQLGGRVTGLRWRGPGGSEGKLTSRYILDCSGQSSLLGTRFNLREFNEEMRHISLSGYYRGARKLSEVYPKLTRNDDGNLHIVSSAAGWFWHIPLADELSSVGFVTDPRHVRGMTPGQRVDYFLDNVAITPELLRLLEPAEWVSDHVEMDSDWSFFCKAFHGPGYMLCGDAACFVDPVLSTGIALAMNGAIRASLTLGAALRRPELEPLAMHWYDTEYRKTAQDFLELALHWYHGERSREDWFWQARRIVDPSQSFSLQQAFSLIAAGVSRSPGATSHLKLKHAGGFSPEQLKVIYQNFELELSDEQQEELEVYLEQERQARDYEPVTTERLLSGIPVWTDGVHWQPYMLNDQEDVLRPATLVEIPDGESTKTHFLSIAATSLLRLLDGSRTGQQIVDDATETWGAAVGKSAAAVRTLVADTLQELHAEGALTVA
jgi:halogenation protein CepH